MSNVEANLHQLVGGLLRPGERIVGHGFVSNTVPVLARLVPILRSAYEGHGFLVATDQRLIRVRAALDFFGKPTGVLGEVAALELSDVAHVAAENPGIVGHAGFVVRRHNGLENRFMYPPTKANVESQGQFATTFVGWLAQGVSARTFAPTNAPPDPRVPVLPPPPMAGSWWLLIALGIVASFMAFVALVSVANGLAAGAVLPLFIAVGAGYLARGRWQAIQQRKALLGGIDPATAAHPTSGPGVPRWKLVAAAAGFVALIGASMLFTVFDERNSLAGMEAYAAEDAARLAALPAEASAWRRGFEMQRAARMREDLERKKSQMTKLTVLGVLAWIAAAGIGAAAMKLRAASPASGS